jgi:two-component system sensor histidine kinase/response regulator
VLLVIADDDRDSAETLAQLLRLLVSPPADVVLATDGQEAVTAATNRTPPPDAVILDLEMPRMDGLTAAIGIRRALGTMAPTLIALTGHAGMTNLPSRSTVFDHALLKPVKVDELLGLLNLTAQL